MEGVRLDAWLNYTCLFKTRSQAAKAIGLGRVKVNGQKVRAHYTVKEEETITIERGSALQTIKVLGVVDHNVSRKEAQTLYEDLTPEPTPEEKERRAMDRLLQVKYDGKGRPGKRDRRAMRRLKGGED